MLQARNDVISLQAQGENVSRTRSNDELTLEEFRMCL